MGLQFSSSRDQFAKAPLVCLWCLLVFLLPALSAHAFVLMGEPDANEAAGFNYTDDFGAPKEISLNGNKRFYRWNTPYFVYSFDSTFVQYFGLEGMDAVHEAFGVVNDFFIMKEKVV